MKTAILLLIWITPSVHWAQSFTFRGNSPFNLNAIDDKSMISSKKPTFRLMFFDLDRDGDLDALHLCIESIDDVPYPTEKNVHFVLERQINGGTKTQPNFGPREAFPNRIPVPEGGYMLADAGDLNNDGAFDMIVCASVDATGNQEMLYYQNKGTSLNPNFTIVKAESLNLEGFIPGSFFVPDLVDLDQDGDLDLVLSGHSRNLNDKYDERPVFKYAKNSGTKSNPKLLGWFENPYNLHPVFSYDMYLESGDLDLDGDIDMLSVAFKNGLPMDFFENTTGANKKPFFAEPYFTLFGVPESGNADNLLLPALVDLDGDQDLDVVIPRTYGFETFQIEYYENTLKSTSLEDQERNDLIIFPNPAGSALYIENIPEERMLGFEVLDIRGKIVMLENGSRTFVPIGSLTNGTYLIRINTTSGQIQKKFIKVN